MDTTELVKRSRQGDREAFEMLVERYWRFAIGVAFSHVGNLADAEDIAQDAFITAYATLGKLREPSKFLAWLKAVVSNTARMFVRSRRSIPEGFLTDIHLGIDRSVPSAERYALQQEVSRQVNAAISVLPDNYREVALLRYFAELPYNQIAEVLELPVSTITYRLRHANGLMRKELEMFMSDTINDALSSQDKAKVITQILDLIAEGCRLTKAGSIDEAEVTFDKACALARHSSALHMEICARLHGLFVQSGFDKRIANRIIRETELAMSLGFEGATWSDGTPIEPWNAHAGLALLYLHLKEYEKSREMFDRAKELGQPYNFNEGNWYVDQGRYEEGIHFLKTLMEDHGDDENGDIRRMCKVNIAYALRVSGKLDEALTAYNQLIDEGKDVGDSWYEIAKIYATKDEPTKFFMALSNAVRENAMFVEWARNQGMFAKYRDLPEFKSVVG